MNAGAGTETRELVALIREGHVAAFVDRAWGLPPVDLADVLGALTESERLLLATSLPPRLIAPALAEMPRDARAETLLLGLDAEHAARLLAELADDDATDWLSRLDESQRGRILSHLEDAPAVGRLLAHAPTSAGGLMTSALVTADEVDSVGLAVESVRRQAASLGDVTEVFVVDSSRRLSGVLSIKQLLLAPPATPVRDVMTRNPVHVEPHEDQRAVARVIARYDLTSVPVVDRSGRLIGRVTADDVRGVRDHEAARDLLRFGGVSHREPTTLSWNAAIRSRLPSLYTNLLGAFAAAAVVYFFRGSVVRVVSLAVWMPVVAGVGGNAGTQALAASVRRLVLTDVRSRRLRGLVAREAAVGAGNGFAIGVVVAAVSVLLGESWRFGLVVLIAMVGNLVLAGVVGAIMPVLLRRAGRDPALASPVFVTALMDACGFALLLGMGSVLLL